MNTSEVVSDPADARIFVNDFGGRTLFYPYGMAWRGYALPDSEGERLLRAAMANHRANMKPFAPWAFCLTIVVWAAGVVLFPPAQAPFLWLASLTAPLIVFVAGERALLRCRLGKLIAGLERVNSRDEAAAHNRRSLLIAAAATAGLIFLILRLYHSRIGAEEATPGTTVYFAGISTPLAITLIFGFFLLVLFAARHNAVARVGENKALLATLAVGLMEVCSVGYVAVVFLNLTPKVIVTRDGLFCHWNVRWSDVTDVNLAYGLPRLGDMYAALKIGPDPNFSIWSSPNIKECEVTGLNRDYAAVYGSIRTAWLATRPGPLAVPSGDAVLDQITVGELRPRVVAKLGAPTLTARTPDGSILLYYGKEIIPSITDPDRHVTAVYFDESDRVTRLARYGLKDGKIFDSVSKTDLLTGAEYPFLETIFFNKSHGG